MLDGAPFKLLVQFLQTIRRIIAFDDFSLIVSEIELIAYGLGMKHRMRHGSGFRLFQEENLLVPKADMIHFNHLNSIIKWIIQGIDLRWHFRSEKILNGLGFDYGSCRKEQKEIEKSHHETKLIE